MVVSDTEMISSALDRVVGFIISFICHVNYPFPLLINSPHVLSPSPLPFSPPGSRGGHSECDGDASAAKGGASLLMAEGGGVSSPGLPQTPRARGGQRVGLHLCLDY